MKVSKKTAIVMVLLIIILPLFAVNTMKTAKSVLILDSLINGTAMEYVFDKIEGEIPPEIGLENGEYSVYHQMAADLDLTKIELMLSETSIVVPESYYNLKKLNKVDYRGEIETYKLICEILTRPEINPPEADMQLTPASIYGSWFNETGMQIYGAPLPFNPYSSKIQVTSNKAYKGPLQFDRRYEINEPSGENDIRMYVYIPVGENASLESENRVLRVKPKELTGEKPDYRTIVGITYERPNNIEEVSEKIIKSAKVELGLRPSAEYMPDVFYTFARKLRTASYGKDIYTFNNNYEESLENLSNRNGDSGQKIKSELIYMFCVQLNSGNIQAHNWTETGIDLNNGGHGLMPEVYMRMIAKYGTLDMSETGLFNGWQEQGELVSSITGKRKGKGHLSQQPIVNTNNLIDNLDLREEFDNTTSQMKSTEYSYTLSYGLECIANGNMIQRGVESAIQQIYDWQKDKGYLLSQGGNITEQSPTSMVKFFGTEVHAAVPWSYTEPIKHVVYHDFNCNNQFCSYHPNNSHGGVDYNYYSVESGERVSPYINAFLEGTVRKVITEGQKSPYGNSVILLHKINGNLYFTQYAHMKEIYLTSSDVGTTVKAGQRLGVEGKTGRVTGVHLHFEMGKIGAFNMKISYDPRNIVEEVVRNKKDEYSQEPD